MDIHLVPIPDEPDEPDEPVVIDIKPYEAVSTETPAGEIEISLATAAEMVKAGMGHLIKFK